MLIVCFVSYWMWSKLLKPLLKQNHIILGIWLILWLKKKSNYVCDNIKLLFFSAWMKILKFSIFGNIQ